MKAIGAVVSREFREIGRTLVENDSLFISAALMGFLTGLFWLMIVHSIEHQSHMTPAEQEAYFQQMSTLDWLN